MLGTNAHLVDRQGPRLKHTSTKTTTGLSDPVPQPEGVIGISVSVLKTTTTQEIFDAHAMSRSLVNRKVRNGITLFR